MSVGIVVVSHSRTLAEGAVELAGEMLNGREVHVVVAAGTAEGGIGTDAMLIQEAIEQVDDGSGVLVMVDLGSAVMSAEMALEFLEPEVAGRVVISPAPLVEGLVAAVVRASLGGALERVAEEAAQAGEAKRLHLEREARKRAGSGDAD